MMVKREQGFLKLIYFLLDGNVSNFKKFLVVFPFIYFISPITIIPYYFFPLAGWLDNILVLGGMSFYIRKMLANYDPEKSQAKNNDSSEEQEIVDIKEDDYEIE